LRIITAGRCAFSAHQLIAKRGPEEKSEPGIVVPDEVALEPHRQLAQGPREQISSWRVVDPAPHARRAFARRRMRLGDRTARGERTLTTGASPDRIEILFQLFVACAARHRCRPASDRRNSNAQSCSLASWEA
jgi:hypothetical protein